MPKGCKSHSKARPTILILVLLTSLFVGVTGAQVPPLLSYQIPPTSEELANLDYGTSLTVNYRGAIKDFFEKVLLDPYSAHLKFDTPQPIWIKQAPKAQGGIGDGGLFAGYMVFVEVNAKNSFGAYTGMKTYGFLYKNNRSIKTLAPEEIEVVVFYKTIGKKPLYH